MELSRSHAGAYQSNDHLPVEFITLEEQRRQVAELRRQMELRRQQRAGLTAEFERVRERSVRRALEALQERDKAAQERQHRVQEIIDRSKTRALQASSSALAHRLAHLKVRAGARHALPHVETCSLQAKHAQVVQSSLPEYEAQLRMHRARQLQRIDQERQAAEQRRLLAAQVSDGAQRCRVLQGPDTSFENADARAAAAHGAAGRAAGERQRAAKLVPLTVPPSMQRQELALLRAQEQSEAVRVSVQREQLAREGALLSDSCVGATTDRSPPR